MAKARESALAFYEKYLLTVEEAAVYYHIGAKKMTQLIKENPKAKMIKRDLFSMWLNQ